MTDTTVSAGDRAPQELKTPTKTRVDENFPVASRLIPQRVRKHVHVFYLCARAADDVADMVVDMREEVIEGLVAQFIPEKAYAEQWETDSLHEEVRRIFGVDLPIGDWAKEEGIAENEIRERVLDASTDRLIAIRLA